MLAPATEQRCNPMETSAAAHHMLMLGCAGTDDKIILLL